MNPKRNELILLSQDWRFPRYSCLGFSLYHVVSNLTYVDVPSQHSVTFHKTRILIMLLIMKTSQNVYTPTKHFHITSLHIKVAAGNFDLKKLTVKFHMSRL
jgi:hypothetical protein